MAKYTEKVNFLTIKQFKQQEGFETSEVIKNPNTGKLFLACDNGQNYKVEAKINSGKEMKFLIPENGDMNEACLVNVKPGGEVMFSI